MVTVGELVAGRYELEAVIGVGGMSRVYRARDRKLQRTVAIKVLSEHMSDDAESVERFQREARTAAGLTHENIVTVIDRGDDDGRSFIVFEYAPGTTLKHLVRADGALPVERALEIALQVASGLAFAHAQGYIHRDVKPQNILVDRTGRVKLTDFGIARALDPTNGFTHTGTVLGSADYIPPEQAQAKTVDERTDIYSLGAVLYELLTGEPPFSGESFVAVAMKHVNEPVPGVREKQPGIPADVDAAVRRALAKNPDHRFPTMEAFAGELEACLRRLSEDDRSAQTQVLSLPPTASRARLGRRWAIAATTALLVGLGATVALFVPPSKRAAAPGGLQKAAAAVIMPVRLQAVAAYDPPPGDGVEDNVRLPLATDGNPSTAWATEWYASVHFGNLKSGVGIVFDAGKPVELRSLTVASDTPGFTCVVKAGPADTGPFRPISAPQTVGRQTTVSLRRAARSRFYLLWITSLSPGTGPHYRVDINGVTAKANSPEE